MFWVATLLPFIFLALSVHAQGTTYAIVNPLTGLVFEDHDPVPGQFGNPIAGAPYNGSPEQLWELGNAPGFAVRLRRERVGGERIFVSADGLPFPGTALLAQELGDSSKFRLNTPFNTANGIFAILSASANVAITAPSVANGTLTLQLYDITNQHQHWIFVTPGTPMIGSSAGTN